MAWVPTGAPISGITRLICTCLLCLASVVGAIVFYRTVQAQPVEGVGSFLVLVTGPIIAAAVFRRPPTILVPIVLFVPYYVVVALSTASGYDESRWSYGRMEAGAFYLAVQLATAWAASTVYRETATAEKPMPQRHPVRPFPPRARPAFSSG